VPPVLPSELYADASHPLSDGYKLLAKQLSEALVERK
jgi:lysophospholipase L1-like esterase